MTSLLTQVDTTSNQINPQQQTAHENMINTPKLDTDVEPHFSNQVKPSSLLVKRFETTELGDLLTKRVKTQSTNTSENGSLQHSPTSKDISDQEKISLDDSLSAAFTRCSSYESAHGLSNQDSFSASPVIIEINSHACLDESALQLQQALDVLREKMVEQDAQDILEMLIKAQLSQEPLYIPPLVESASEFNQFSKKQVNNKETKKMQIEDVTYGSIEFPFLAFSTPFPQNGDLTTLNFSDLPQATIELSCKDPYLDEKIPVAFSNIEKKGKKSATFSIKKKQPSSIKSPSQESNSSNEINSVKRKEAQIKAKKIISKAVEPVVQKKAKENENDKKVSKGVEITKLIKQDKQDDIYARPVPSRRRFTQRTKNRWQIAQDEKVKDIVLPALNFNGGYELFLEGNKKNSVPIGSEYQVNVSAVLENRTNTRRKPQMKWNPSAHKQTELQKFFGKVESMVNGNINQEKVVNIISKNKNDLKRALKYISTNKSKCLETLRN